eukprot:scaffold680722_cov74-Prasinocladus_malaysianus.AAC.1
MQSPFDSSTTLRVANLRHDFLCDSYASDTSATVAYHPVSITATAWNKQPGHRKLKPVEALLRRELLSQCPQPLVKTPTWMIFCDHAG